MNQPRYRNAKLKTTDKILLGTIVAWLAIVAGGAVNAKTKLPDGNVRGDGHMTEEARPLANFDEVTVLGAVNVHYVPGSKSECRLHAESNVLPKVKTAVKGNALEIRIDGNIFTQHSVNAVCTSPGLKSFHSKGTSRSRLTDLSGKGLTLMVQGTGDIEASGQVERVDASVQGTGHIKLDQLAIQHANLHVQGTGNIHAAQAVNVNASIAGTGNVIISHEANVEGLNIRGVGKLKRQ